jgi:cell wall-associated NlpC family hydrolase
MERFTITKQLIFFAFTVLFVNLEVKAQVPALDKLEMLYDQGHYRMVYRRANRYLDKPDYDFSLLPSYYKSLATLQLAQETVWSLRNPRAHIDALNELNRIKITPKGKLIFESHIVELQNLKTDIEAWVTDLRRQKKNDEATQIANLANQLFEKVKFREEKSVEAPSYSSDISVRFKSRTDMVSFSKKYLGVPYVSAGDTPQGFDCSGFTSFVFSHHQIKLPRRAAEQYQEATKIKEKDAMMGDLVFFSNGGEVSHVGMLINEPGKPKVMIHASSSKGIQIIELESSNYWKQRIVGFGRFME